MRPRKSTAILMATWIATFVLYLFVKPETPVSTGVQWPSVVPVAESAPAPAP